MTNPRQYGSNRAAVIFTIALVLSPASQGSAAPLVAPPVARGDLALPVSPACISSPFGPRRVVGPRAATFHNGIDFPAPAGAGVRAARGGQVVAIRRIGAEGLAIDILHAGADGGYVTRYAHLGSVVPALAEGQRNVAAGGMIGRIGRTGVTYGTHLHFEIRVRGSAIDPEPYFDVKRCG